jgi:chemotaxis protein methyltransferase CheR
MGDGGWEEALDVVAATRTWVETHCGIKFAPEQDTFFRARLEGLCRREDATLKAVYARLLAGDRALVLRVAEAVSTNYTEMFRERETFELLAKTILPALPPGQVRIWSAAASSGEEAYSIAIVAQEAFGEAGAAERVRVLGTDLSERHVRAAETGIFGSQRLALLDPARRACFRPAGLDLVVARASLRAMCTFRRMNLTQSTWPFEQRFHVIFLRNVLYYFDAPTRRRVVESCYDAAEPGAWLVTSFTEPMLDLATRWHPIGPATFRKVVA